MGAASSKPNKINTVAIGMAMFSMFFGSGNIIFPVLIGQATLSQAAPAMDPIWTGSRSPTMKQLASGGSVDLTSKRHSSRFANKLQPGLEQNT